MDIHKSKPWHSWRELSKEVGTIVIGVLIALAGEQTIEALHWRHEVQQERAALNSEAQDFLGAAAVRVREQPCLTEQFQDLETVFQRHELGQPFRLRRPVQKPSGLSGTRGTWQIALAGQALSHMPLKEKLAYAAAFDVYDSFNRGAENEAAPWAKLTLLNHPRMMNEEDWSALHQAYAEALNRSPALDGLAAFILKSDNLGLRPSEAPAELARSLTHQCEPLIDRDTAAHPDPAS
jgi:hypothetical protein